MKAEIIETKKNFEPIEIKLVIESEEELCDLWHRINIEKEPFLSVKYLSMNALVYNVSNENNLVLYHKLDYLVKEHNLVKQ